MRYRVLGFRAYGFLGLGFRVQSIGGVSWRSGFGYEGVWGVAVQPVWGSAGLVVMVEDFGFYLMV